MSIVKGLILVVFFIMLYKINVLKSENLKQKDYFIKTLSHDFRVATIAQLRGLEALDKISNFSQLQKELISEINKSCLYSLDLISMLQNIYKFENGEQVVKYDFFNLQKILNIVSKEIYPLLEEKKILLKINSVDFCYICGDENMLHKLILLLLTTAIDYSESNSEIIFISNTRDKKWKCSLIYKGKTMTEEECNRMFSLNTRFSTVGHGIKMHLCKKIVDFHKGKIFVKKISERHNSFTFNIPQYEKFNNSKPLIATSFKLCE